MHSSRQCRWSSGLRDSPAEGGAQRLISRVTGQVDLIGFHLSDKGVNQDLTIKRRRWFVPDCRTVLVRSTIGYHIRRGWTAGYPNVASNPISCPPSPGNSDHSL